MTVSLVGAFANGCCGTSLCVNGDFQDGMRGWNVSEKARTRIVGVEEASSSSALEIQAPPDGRGWVASESFTVEPDTRYQFRAMVRRIRGGAGCSFHLEWLDENRQHLAYVYASVATLAGRSWVPWHIEAIAPPGARFGLVSFNLPPGAACLVGDVRVSKLSMLGQRLEIDLISEPITKGADTTHQLCLRIENRGDLELRDLEGTIELPRGIACDQETTFSVSQLGFSDSFRRSFVLAGYPGDIDDPVRCTVRAATTSGPVEVTESERLFVTTPMEKPTCTSDLPYPRRLELPVKLGCYYFPVMLDWDRNNWGVRKVDYLEPRLGYYDEALPEVADWHITWALEHGISFFVFDWYFNQGYEYLNDALDKGFLGSRFADSMEFCVDWCNEGHCGEFKKVVFDLPALEEFVTVLCERYFVRSNYLRVDGKPVVIVHVPLSLVNGLGDWDKCRQGLDSLRKIARRHGYPGVYFVALQSNNPYLPDYRSAGFDAVTAYAYGFCDVQLDEETRSLDYEKLIPRHRECFEIASREASRLGLDYIPSAWVGWDDSARSKERAVRTDGNTPGAFRRMLEFLPGHANNPAKLALFESWNEWGEGGQAEPGKPYGFGRLAAIRDSLAKKRGPYEILVPREADVRQLETTVTCDQVDDMYRRRYARKLGLDNGLRMDFDSAHDVTFHPSNGLSGVRNVKGCLAGTTANDDPALVGPPCMGLPARDVHSVEVRVRANPADGAGSVKAELFWQRKGDPGFAADRGLQCELSVDGRFHICRFDVSGHPEWNGIVDRLRLDPMPGAGSFEIDWIRTVQAQ